MEFDKLQQSALRLTYNQGFHSDPNFPHTTGLLAVARAAVAMYIAEQTRQEAEKQESTDDRDA